MAIDLSAIGKPLGPATYDYTDRDVMLYALGIGATTEDLDFVYEKNLKVFPSFAVVPGFQVMMSIGQVLTFNAMMLLHGEQRIDLKAPIPTRGKLTSAGKVSAIYDKGSGAVVIIDSATMDEAGKVLFTNTSSVFLRGEGGFGGDRGPSATGKNVPPERTPDHAVEYKTSPDQATLYRLSGDRNPLHIDRDFAKMAGFDRPILHGLCTFGYVGRAILNSCCGGDPARFKDFEVRFSGVVYPGETIVTQIWRDGNRALVHATTKERGDAVISNAASTIA